MTVYSRIEYGREGDEVDARRQDRDEKVERHLGESSNVLRYSLVRVVDLLRSL